MPPPGTPAHERARLVLERYLAHDDPMLREHAVWAAHTGMSDHP
jgi:epoxyqueuosine reductase QueG